MNLSGRDELRINNNYSDDAVNGIWARLYEGSTFRARAFMPLGPGAIETFAVTEQSYVTFVHG